MHRPHFPVAVLGHRGHGKSTLCAALATLTTSSPVLRGAPDDVRTCRAPVASKRITLLDVPGGPRSVRAALRACGVADAAVLVVSSTAGPQAQTREHVLAAKAAGLSPLIVVINDFDGDRELVAICEQTTRALLVEHGEAGDDAVVVVGSLAKDAAVVAAAVKDAVEHAAVRVFDDDEAALVRVLFFHPRLSRAQRLAGGNAAAVASGRLLRGTLRAGDAVRVLGVRGRVDATSFRRLDAVADDARQAAHNIVARVARVEVEHAVVDVARAGEHVGVALAFDGAAPVVDRQSSVLVAPQASGPTTVVQARLTLRAAAIGGRAHPLVAGFECLAWTGSTSTACVVLPVDSFERGGDAVVAADAAFDAVVVLALPRFAMGGMPLVLTGDGGVIASGVVVDKVSRRDEGGWLDRVVAVRARRGITRHSSARARRQLAPV